MTKRTQLFAAYRSMSSLKQIEANRRNALKSTGPTTQEGKERSRCNALRHGLTAETIIAALENAEDYQAFEAAVTADYDAETAVERELVLRLASVLWRLRRATGIETALFEFATEESWQGPLRPTLAGEQPDPLEAKCRRRMTKPSRREGNRFPFDKGHCGLLLAAGHSTDLPAGSSEPLRTHALAAGAPDHDHIGVIAPPPASAQGARASRFSFRRREPNDDLSEELG